jgi:hypothetical protein
VTSPPVVKSLTLLAALALLSPSLAVAQQDRDTPSWVRIHTRNEPDVQTYVDLKSIRSGNGYRQVWVKDVFAMHRNKVREVRVQYEADCKEASVRVLQSRIYLQDGSKLDRNESENWLSILPDDGGGLKALYDAVCGAKLRP